MLRAARGGGDVVPRWLTVLALLLSGATAGFAQSQAATSSQTTTYEVAGSNSWFTRSILTAQNIANTRAVRAINSVNLRYVEERVRKGTGEDLSPLFTPFCIHMMAQLFMSTVIKSRHFLIWTRRTKIFNGTRDALANPRALKRCPADRVFALGYLQRGAR